MRPVNENYCKESAASMTVSHQRGSQTVPAQLWIFVASVTQIHDVSAPITG